jgi:hypothetical protein
MGTPLEGPVVEHFHEFIDQGQRCQVEGMGDGREGVGRKIEKR